MESAILVNHVGDKRTELGLTQQQLAERLGWTLRKLTSYERNERVPPVTEAIALARALGVPVEELWTVK